MNNTHNFKALRNTDLKSTDFSSLSSSKISDFYPKNVDPTVSQSLGEF
jgi:hypothetical protein